ncbi:hypothetical protein ACIBH1_32690 [Nonomuraea sp. NPDC050663]|uniref:hypothetical protein n=1 Tax=Nonomuraea sp. NPDC050663 TaxID=3364370 RepID=UPI0037A4B41D
MSPALFRFEVRRSLRNPLLWGAALLCFGLRLHATWGWLPDMSVEPASTGGALLILAAAAMMAAYLAVSRDRRMAESLLATTGDATARTAAATGAAALTGIAYATAVMAAYLAIRWYTGPVAGVFALWDAVDAIIAVGAAAALGALLGRWTPWLVAVPTAAFTLGALIYFNGNQGGYGGWFLPIVLFHGPDWPARPSGLHTLYLMAAIVACSCAALARHSSRWLVAAVAALAVMVPAGAAATAAGPGDEMANRYTGRSLTPQIRERYIGPDVRRSCETHSGLDYCAYPAYAAWIPVWVSALDPVVRALPPAARADLPPVLQGTDSWFLYQDDHASRGATMVWSRGNEQRAALAADAVRRALAIRPAGRDGCDLSGQGRALVALWLLGQSVAPRLASYAEVQVGSSVFLTVRSPLGNVVYGPAELELARRLLAVGDGRERVWAHWDVLTDPRTSLSRAAELLGLPAPGESVVRGERCA